MMTKQLKYFAQVNTCMFYDIIFCSHSGVEDLCILRYDAVYIGVGHLARERNKRRAVVDTLTNLQVP
jgi:hypothetical protein